MSERIRETSTTPEAGAELHKRVIEAQRKLSNLIETIPAQGPSFEGHLRKIEEANEEESETLRQWLDEVKRQMGQPLPETPGKGSDERKERKLGLDLDLQTVEAAIDALHAEPTPRGQWMLQKLESMRNEGAKERPDRERIRDLEYQLELPHSIPSLPPRAQIIFRDWYESTRSKRLSGTVGREPERASSDFEG